MQSTSLNQSLTPPHPHPTSAGSTRPLRSASSQSVAACISASAAPMPGKASPGVTSRRSRPLLRLPATPAGAGWGERG